MFKELTAYILAGGKSSRMGQDKGLLMLDNNTFITQIINQLKPIVDKIIIVSDNPDHDQLGVEVIPDLVKNIGPIGGIYSALYHAVTPMNIIISCDTPLVTEQLFSYIISKVNSKEVTVINYKDKIHPLIGVYTTSCLPVIEKAIERKEYKLIRMLDQLDANVLSVGNQSWFNEQILSNINTPQEYKQIQTVWK